MENVIDEKVIKMSEVNDKFYERERKRIAKTGNYPKFTQKEMFFRKEEKDRYSIVNRMSENELEDLKDAVDGDGMWNLLRKEVKVSNRWKDTIKVEDVKSKFENETPGYVGRMSGDLIAQKKGSITLGGKVYTREFTKRYDTRGFW